MLRALGSLIFTASVLVVPGCSSDPEPGPKYPTVASFCDAKAAAECDTIAAKCAAKPEACAAARKASCEAFVAKVQTGVRTYQPKAAEPCVAKAKEVYAKATITPDDTRALDATCDSVFRGSVAKGKACAGAGECSGDLVCDKGVCADKVEKKTGDFCGNPGEVCDANSYCTAGAAPNSIQCIAKKAKGDGCSATDPCNDTLRCNTFCTDRLSSGDACASDADCGSSAPFCDIYNGSKCSAGIIAAPGTPVCAQEFGGT
jgi:hypothetical protein